MTKPGAALLQDRPDDEPQRDRRPPWWISAAVGVVATVLTGAIAELLALFGAWLDVTDLQVASPVRALGSAFIAITPEWLKEFAISTFGQHDKVALGVSMAVTSLLLAVAIGLIGRHRPRVAACVAGALVVVVAIAVLTRPDAGVADALPTLVGGVVGMWFLLRAFEPRVDPYAEVHGTSNTELATVQRRNMLRLTGIGATVALVAGAAARWLPGPVDIQGNRAAVTLPPVGTTSAASPTAAPPTSVLGTPLPQNPAVVATEPLPTNINPPVADLTPYVTANADFYRIDTAFTLPRVPTTDWRLTVHGMVAEPFTLTWDDVTALPQIERVVTLACVSNVVGGDLAGNAVWQGVRVADLLARAQPQQVADCVYSTSADGFTVATPLQSMTDSRDALLAIGMNGSPLPVEHGFPARLVVPGLYGYVSATKWVVDLEVTQFSQVSAYWTDRGWSPLGPIKTASRIDTPHYDVSVPAGVVPVAGVAWAQTRGISAVQVQVDSGPWMDAELSGVASVNTWRQWVLRWDTSEVPSGKHVLRCRAIDGTGKVQDETPAPPAPNGASGYHEVPVVVRRS